MIKRWRSLVAAVLLLTFAAACAGIPAQKVDVASASPTLHSTASGTAAFFMCSNRVPERVRAPKAPQCDDTVYWDYAVAESRTLDPVQFEKTIVAELTEHQNMGGARFRFPSGVEKTVYRGSFLTANLACLEELVKERNVQSVVNLYRGELQSHFELADEEERAFESFGGRSYLQILNYTYRLDRQTKDALFQRVAEIVRVVESAPGDVMVHCFGGMHRTGVLFGVMQKCLNHIPVDQVLNEYRCHTDWQSDERPGGASKDNETAIREFPCELLAPVQ
jgi:protein-tyrosine phosphatase family protein